MDTGTVSMMGEAVLDIIVSLARRVLAAAAVLTPLFLCAGPVAAQQADPPPKPEPTTLFGDWGGLKTDLANLGIRVKADFVTETAWNVAGGLRQGADYTQQIGIQGYIDWEKLAGIDGFSTNAVFVNRAGRNASKDYIGDPVIQAQEVYGAGFDMAIKLVYLYGEQKLLDGRLSLAAGRLAVGADYAASPLYCNFMTLTICGHPRALTSNQGFTDWPTASWGGRARFNPTPDTYIMAGIYESKPFPPGNRSGFDWSTTTATGVAIPVELAWQPSFGADQLPGHYKVGVDFDDSYFPDNFYNTAGQPLTASNLPARKDQGRTSVWVTADQMLLRNGPGEHNGLILLAAYAHNSPDISLFEHFAWVGVLDKGFWPARPRDQFGFAVTYYKVSSSLNAIEGMQSALGMPFTNGELGVQSSAYVLEANYSIALFRGIAVQPELEYFVRPGGQTAVHDAFVVGLKTYVEF